MKRFSVVQNGYDIDEVNRFIDIVIARLEKLNTENVTYVAKIEKLTNQLKNNNTTDYSKLEKAILAVQDTSDRIKELAKKEADMILDEAKNNANSIVHEALIKAEKIEQEKMLLEKKIRVSKEKMKNILNSELELLNELEDDI